MRFLAPAKINLFLTVGARRADGLHEIVSVMQSVSLADELSLEPGPDLTLAVEPAGAAPSGEDNIALRAALALRAATGTGSGAALSLTKRIPVAAGLGGGSADAAAALVGLNRLWDAGLSRKALERLGAGLGADVPFCVRGGTALALGAGERLSPLSCPTLWWVIGVSGSSLSTAEVYAELDRLGAGTPGDPADLAAALARGDAEAAAGLMANDLEAPAAALLPSAAEGRAALLDAGALGAVMAGSGPTWCGLARDEAHARDVAGRASPAFARVEVARSLDHGPRVARA